MSFGKKDLYEFWETDSEQFWEDDSYQGMPSGMPLVNLYQAALAAEGCVARTSG